MPQFDQYDAYHYQPKMTHQRPYQQHHNNHKKQWKSVNYYNNPQHSQFEDKEQYYVKKAIVPKEVSIIPEMERNVQQQTHKDNDVHLINEEQEPQIQPHSTQQIREISQNDQTPVQANPGQLSSSEGESYCSKTKLITHHARKRNIYQSKDGQNIRLNKSRISPSESQSQSSSHHNYSNPGIYVNNAKHSFDFLPPMSQLYSNHVNDSNQYSDSFDFYSVRSQQQFRPFDYNGILRSSMEGTIGHTTESRTKEEGSNSIASGFNEESQEVLNFFDQEFKHFNFQSPVVGIKPFIRPRHQSHNNYLKVYARKKPDGPIRSRQRSFVKSKSKPQSSTGILAEDKDSNSLNKSSKSGLETEKGMRNESQDLE